MSSDLVEPNKRLKWTPRRLGLLAVGLALFICGRPMPPSVSQAAEETGAAGPQGPHIVVTSVRPPDQGAMDASPYGLTRRDYDRIVNALPNLQLAVPVREVRRRARFGEEAVAVQLIGTVPDYPRLHERPVARGRFLVDQDMARLRNVAVIGEHVARTLFFGGDPVGQRIRIDDNYFLVVGTIKTRPRHGRNGAADEAADQIIDDPASHVYIPLSTMSSRLGDREVVRTAGTLMVEHFQLSRIEMLFQNIGDVPKSAVVVENLLDRRHEGEGSKSYSVTTWLDQRTRRQK